MAETKTQEKKEGVAEGIKDAVEEVGQEIKNTEEKIMEKTSKEEAKKQEQTEEKPKAKKKVKPASKRAGMIVKAKKKTAIARGVIKKGKGIIKVNKINLNNYAGGYLLDFIKEPLELAGDATKDFDITISVRGSGFMSQAVAVRAAIAKAIVKVKGKKFKEIFQNYDRMLLVDDIRQVEPKKPLGRKARKKWQHSKR